MSVLDPSSVGFLLLLLLLLPLPSCCLELCSGTDGSPASEYIWTPTESQSDQTLQSPGRMGHHCIQGISMSSIIIHRSELIIHSSSSPELVHKVIALTVNGRVWMLWISRHSLGWDEQCRRKYYSESPLKGASLRSSSSTHTHHHTHTHTEAYTHKHTNRYIHEQSNRVVTTRTVMRHDEFALPPLEDTRCMVDGAATTRLLANLDLVSWTRSDNTLCAVMITRNACFV